MRLNNLRRDLREAELELSDIYAMSEEAACFRYNVNNKDEAIEILEEVIQSLQAEIAEAEELQNTEYAGWCDPAFRSIDDFYRMRI